MAARTLHGIVISVVFAVVLGRVVGFTPVKLGGLAGCDSIDNRGMTLQFYDRGSIRPAIIRRGANIMIMRFLCAILFAIVPVTLGIAIVTNFRNLGAFFSKEGGVVVPVVKVTGWFFILLPMYPVISELINLFD
jgi:hypothetical protein